MSNKQPVQNRPMVGESPLTGDFFYYSRWRLTGNGVGMVAVGPKKDVTEPVKAIISQHTGALRAAMELAVEAIEDGRPDDAADGLNAAMERREL